MARRLPTYAERAERAQRRAQRLAELREFGAIQRQELVELAVAVARLAEQPQQVPDERLAAQLDRLQAARAALDLAAHLLQVDRAEEDSIERQNQLTAALGRWRRSSTGWWEMRWVPRPRFSLKQNAQTKEQELHLEWEVFGPYGYFHWRQEGKQETHYYGYNLPADAPWVDPRLPEINEAELSPLTREAIARARHLRDIASLPRLPKARRARLQRVLRRAVKRAQRRLDQEELSIEGESEPS